MVAQEPDGATTNSASSKRSRTRAATSRVSCRQPVLKAGWPQQVCAGLKVTSTPSRRKTSTAHSPTVGKNWSARQVMKSATRGGFAAITSEAWISFASAAAGFDRGLLGRVTAVHHQGRGRDVRSIVRHQEKDDRSDFARLAHSGEESFGALFRIELLETHPYFFHVPEGSGREDGAGTDAVHADLVRAEVHCHVARHLDDGRFRRAVGEEIRLGDESGNGAQV